MLESIKDRKELFANIEEIVYNCCNIKRKVVEDDELDTGGRMILNFGHTFGHAIEKKYKYETYTHGEGVAVGMVMASELGEKLGITKPKTADRIRNILNNYNLPTKVDVGSSDLADAVAVDKKGEGSKINLILLDEIGKVIIKKTDKKDFAAI